MRVIHVITRLIIGGAQENTIASVLGLRQKHGIDCTLISGPTEGPEGSLASSFDEFPGVLTVIRDLVRPVSPRKDVCAWRHLIRHFRHERPDIVHTHSGKAGFLGRMAAARAGVPVIVHTIHGPSFGNFQGRIANSAFRFAEVRAGRLTTHFVSVAQAMTRKYLAAGIAGPSQYSTIYSGFELPPLLGAANDPAWRARWGLQAEDVVIGKIARLFKLKGHEALFKVAPEVARANGRVKFMLVGDGEWRQRFQQQVKDIGLERSFIFTGLVSPAEIPRFIGIMDIVVHLSRREGLARVLPQALAAARPVVVYDSDGANEVCLDNETGFLIQPGDISGLAKRLIQLAGDPGLRQRLGRRGRELVRERFGVEQMVNSLYALYLKLVESTGTTRK
jgi:glycosyltransferase involved in cell wall biosynthesis